MGSTMLAVILDDQRDISAVKQRLGALVSKRRKVERRGGEFWIYCKADNTLGITLGSIATGCRGGVKFASYDEDEGADLQPLQRLLKEFVRSTGAIVPAEPQLMQTCPKTWTLYRPMVLFGANSFGCKSWGEFLSEYGPDFFLFMLQHERFAKCTHVAINRPIQNDDVMRRPFSITPVFGDFGPEPNDRMYNQPAAHDFDQAFWCSAVQNGIYQEWAPRFTMFSRGNIKEKKRVLQFGCEKDDFVVDMYAGIGYFTLSYLHNGAVVFCWELNPWSIEGLRRGMSANGHRLQIFQSQDEFTLAKFNQLRKEGVCAFVFAESNIHAMDRLSVLDHVPIRHINLGLLPSSRGSWSAARKLAAKSAVCTSIHVHENVHVGDIDRLAEEVGGVFGTVEHVEKVKTFAPDVWHVVVDVRGERRSEI